MQLSRPYWRLDAPERGYSELQALPFAERVEADKLRKAQQLQLRGWCAANRAQRDRYTSEAAAQRVAKRAGDALGFVVRTQEYNMLAL